jgi:hypothetical protein
LIGHRLDVFFEDGETPFDLAIALLSICAFPEPKKLLAGGPANRFWDSINTWVTRPDGRCLYPLTGLPQVRLDQKKLETHFNKGFRRLDLLLDLYTAFAFYAAPSPIMRLTPSRDVQRVTLQIQFDDSGRVVPFDDQGCRSLTDFLQTYQPVIGLGHDELGSNEIETTKTNRKRLFAPMMRVAHLLGVLKSEVLSLPDGDGSWPVRLLRADPSWAIRVVQSAPRLVNLEVNLARALGSKTASPEAMVHFHLPSHLNFAPNTTTQATP